MSIAIRFIAVALVLAVGITVRSRVGWAQANATNMIDGCITDYDPDTNYFPEQMTVDHAEGFTIEYFNAYKLVTVTRPWVDAVEPFVYALVQCGAPIPADLPENAAVIEIPVATAASLSATYAPHFIMLGELESLVAIDEADYIYNESIRERVDAGQIAEIGGGSGLDVERALDLAPGVTFTYGSGFPEYDAHPMLIDAGLPVALNGDFNERDPLGRAEWIKFTAAFFNREAAANFVVDEVVASYEALREVAAQQTERPTVLVNAMYTGTWYVSGGDSYAARLISDAGGDYLFADDASTGGVPLTFEAVLDTAFDAEVWINPNTWRTRADGLVEDERYSVFAAFQTGRIYNNNLRSNAAGGNDYFEYGGARPDWVLVDLIAIFYPDLLPDHTLYFYQPLP